MSRYNALVVRDFKELYQRYEGIYLEPRGNSYLVKGVIYFVAQYLDEVIEDKYEIEIMIPGDYPESPPSARETGKKIRKNFHINPDGTLCLGAPAAVWYTFNRNNSLLGFVDDLVIPFLYSYSYLVKKGNLPYGELAHGTEGIIQFYCENFNVNPDKVIPILKVLSRGNYRGHLLCPCGSGLKIRYCHKDWIKDLIQTVPTRVFEQDISDCRSVIKPY